MQDSSHDHFGLQQRKPHAHAVAGSLAKAKEGVANENTDIGNMMEVVYSSLLTVTMQKINYLVTGFFALWPLL